MKNILLIIVIAIVILGCTSTKQVTETPPKNGEFDTSVIVEDKVTISNGKLINKTEPISEQQNNSTVSTGTKITKTVPVKEMPTVTKSDDIEEDIKVINPMQVPPQPSVSPDPITIEKESLKHTQFNSLLQKHVSAKGNVNYEGFKKDRNKLRAYINLLAENVPNDDWTHEDKLAYWMNAYNAMTVDLILRNLPLQSIKDIKKPWDQRLWKLEDKWYNLEQIEHQILRKMGDPRIHFGINCASFSCPPLLNEAFTAAKVHAQLDAVAKKFINDPSRNMISESSVEVSKIFSWFAKDFKENGNLIDYLNQFSNIQINSDAKVRYMDYNWELNN